MRSTRIITAFVRDGDRYLIVRRSGRVRTMKGMWAAISGMIEGREPPLKRAKTEILEELGIPSDQLRLVRRGRPLMITSPQYKDHQWEVFPFLFAAKKPRIRLNWENSQYKWVTTDQLARHKTVPSLEKVLLVLL